MLKGILQTWILGVLLLNNSVLVFAAEGNMQGRVIEDDQVVFIDENTVVDENNKPVVMEQNPEAVDPEKQVLMAKMQEYSTPNENHQVLALLAGEWHAHVKLWMDPKGEPEVSQGSSVSEMTMGGRFLHQIYRGQFMGQKFEGTGIYGYDNLRKEYRSVWYDNMATGIMVSSGKYDSATKTWTDEGTMSCPVTNGDRWFKSVTRIIDPDHYIYETYMKDEKTGEVFRSMEIDYTRVK